MVYFKVKKIPNVNRVNSFKNIAKSFIIFLVSALLLVVGGSRWHTIKTN